MRLVHSMLVTAALISGCGAACENEVSEIVNSPSGKLKAVVFTRSCGATVGFNTQVSVLPVEVSLPNEGGNILVVGGSVPLQLRWGSDSLLQIAGALPTQVFKQEKSAGGVSVTYGKQERSNKPLQSARETRAPERQR